MLASLATLAKQLGGYVAKNATTAQWEETQWLKLMAANLEDCPATFSPLLDLRASGLHADAAAVAALPPSAKRLRSTK